MRTEQKKNHKNITSFLFLTEISLFLNFDFWLLLSFQYIKIAKYLELKKSIIFLQVPTHYLKPFLGPIKCLESNECNVLLIRNMNPHSLEQESYFW